ncbi:hypothetical protein N7527_001897 [Penicillium freii]|nr:hypothetical protein N7527_001897 [Penicillium freii]
MYSSYASLPKTLHSLATSSPRHGNPTPIAAATMGGFTDEECKVARRIKALRDWCDAEYEKQLRKGQLEVTNLWNKTDGDGDKIEQTKGQRGGASHWKLMALAPEQDLFDAAGNVKRQPKYVRLTDDAAIMSLCIHDKVYRATYLPMKID